MQYSFHGFDIMEKIAAGGMSTVYKGVHQTLGYPVAVKILHPGLAGDTNFIKRFEREAKAASALRCNNIASVIDFGSEDDVYFIVMEFINGHDLAQIFKAIHKSTDKAGAFPIEIALLLIEEVAYGLKEAHEHGLIHRDIKPANILIDKRGEVKIADFGLARDTSDLGHPNSLELTTPGTVLGTPSYMSPEQAAGKADLDNRTDIFSLGVMAYQLITGQKPFQGDTPTAVQEKIINTNPQPLTLENCPLLTAEIDTMIGKMLAKDPQKRYSTMDKLLRGLKESMESIDSTGNLNRYRRDYLSNFAKDAVSFSKELRDKSVSGHLKLGYHHKNQGLSNIDDAIREFTYVLSIDPDNAKASEALKELRRRQLEHGGVEDTSPEDVTQVMSQLPVDSSDKKTEDAAPVFEPSAEIPIPEPDTESTTVMAPGTTVVEPSGSVAAVSPPSTPPAPPPPSEPSVEAVPVGGSSGGSSGSSSEAKIAGLKRPVFIGACAALLALVVIIFAVSQRGGSPDTLENEPIATVVTNEDTEPDLSAEGTPAEQTPATDLPGNDQETAIAAVDSTIAPITDLAAAPVPEQPEVVADAGTAEAVETPVEAPPEIGQGRVKVASRPAGAQVQIRKRGQRNYQVVGVTPYTSELMEEGRWDVRVSLEGYEAQGIQGRIDADKTQNYNFPLKAIPSAVVEDGFARLVISPFGDVIVDGEHRMTEAKLAVLKLSSGKPHKIEIIHKATFSKMVLNDVRVTPGDTIRLPRQVHQWGSLAVSSNSECEIMVDDQWKGPQKRWQLARVGAGQHIVSVRRQGLVVEAATLLVGNERRELQPINANEFPARYLIDVAKKADVKLHFRMKQGS